MTAPVRHSYSHLETDAELLDRASAAAGHRITAMCCGRSYMGRSTEELCDSHGTRRALVWVE